MTLGHKDVVALPGGPATLEHLQGKSHIALIGTSLRHKE